MTFSAKSFGFAAAFAGALALGTSALAFPVMPAKSSGTAVIQVAHKKSHHEMSRVESESTHQAQCWVKTDATRGFGYFKC